MSALLRLGVPAPREDELPAHYPRPAHRRRPGHPGHLVCLDGERFLVRPTATWAGCTTARGPSVAAARGRHSERLVADEVEAAPAGSVLRHYVKQVPITAPFFDAGRDRTGRGLRRGGPPPPGVPAVTAGALDPRAGARVGVKVGSASSAGSRTAPAVLRRPATPAAALRRRRAHAQRDGQAQPGAVHIVLRRAAPEPVGRLLQLRAVIPGPWSRTASSTWSSDRSVCSSMSPRAS